MKTFKEFMEHPSCGTPDCCGACSESTLDEAETKYVVKGKSPFYKQDHYINTHETPKAHIIKNHIKHATRMDLETAKKVAKDWESHPNKYKTSVVPVNEEVELDESESWEAGYKRRVVKTTDAEHKEKGMNWRIKGKERPEISIKLYKEKPSQEEFNKQMKRVAGHEFGG